MAARNNGIHVKGRKPDKVWYWRVIDCTMVIVRTPAVCRTQREAIAAGRALAKKKRCELVIHGRNGKIRRKDSYGRDPRRIKG